MSLRGLRLATQFLTRLPVPGVTDFSAADLSRSAVWFPLVGVVVGALVAVTIALTARYGAFLSAVLAVLVWVGLTGALHLDGLADLADALGASHRDPQRFLTVLADPHVGTFGAVTIVLALLVKTAALATLHPALAHPGALTQAGALTHGWRMMYGLPIDGLPLITSVPLIAAWARLGPLAWSRWLPPLKAGQGERFAWSLQSGWIVAWTILLFAASAWVTPVLCIAPLALLGWGLWLKLRVGGVTGDCLGAGVEVVEIVLLLVVVGGETRLLFLV
jgi:adenosylcobinamide-GDP ribazoletransferase